MGTEPFPLEETIWTTTISLLTTREASRQDGHGSVCSADTGARLAWVVPQCVSTSVSPGSVRSRHLQLCDGHAQRTACDRS